MITFVLILLFYSLSELMTVTQAGIMSLVESNKAAFWDQFYFKFI